MCVFIYCKCKVYLVAIHSGALKSWISVLMDRNDPQGGIVVVCESPFIFGLLPGYLGSVFRAAASAWFIQALHMRWEQQVKCNLHLGGSLGLYRGEPLLAIWGMFSVVSSSGCFSWIYTPTCFMWDFKKFISEKKKFISECVSLMVVPVLLNA